LKESKNSNKCFVISPIGKEGTENYDRFKEVLDYIIKPAIENSDHDLEVIRADEINKTGSLIKDILTNIYNSFIVIADLTGQNPNVFYELGVRHCLKPRTILIAQSIEDIPFDLKDYRTIIYESSAKGAILFKEELNNYLTEIFETPDNSDNPVLDRLGDIIKQRIIELENENKELRESKQENDELHDKIKFISNASKEKGHDIQEEYISTRINRIIKLMKLEDDYSLLMNNYAEYILPPHEGNFRAHMLYGELNKIYYISNEVSNSNFETELADIRVLAEDCSKSNKRKIIFVMATNDDLSKKKEIIQQKFSLIKQFVNQKSRHWFSLEIWDKSVLLEKEKALGIKV